MSPPPAPAPAAPLAPPAEGGFLAAVAATVHEARDRPALGPTGPGTTPVTWGEVGRRVRALALGVGAELRSPPDPRTVGSAGPAGPAGPVGGGGRPGREVVVDLPDPVDALVAALAVLSAGGVLTGPGVAGADALRLDVDEVRRLVAGGEEDDRRRPDGYERMRDAVRPGHPALREAGPGHRVLTWSHGALWWAVRSLLRAVPIGSDDRLLVDLAPGTAIAHLAATLVPAATGCAVAAPGADVADVARTVPAWRPTVVIGAAATTEALLAEVLGAAGRRALGRAWLRRAAARPPAPARSRRPAPRWRGDVGHLGHVAREAALDRAVGGAIRRAVGLEGATLLVVGAGRPAPDVAVLRHLGVPVTAALALDEVVGPVAYGPPPGGHLGPAPGASVAVEDGRLLVRCPGVADEVAPAPADAPGSPWWDTGRPATLDRARGLVPAPAGRR